MERQGPWEGSRARRRWQPEIRTPFRFSLDGYMAQLLDDGQAATFADHLKATSADEGTSSSTSSDGTTGRVPHFAGSLRAIGFFILRGKTLLVTEQDAP